MGKKRKSFMLDEDEEQKDIIDDDDIDSYYVNPKLSVREKSKKAVMAGFAVVIIVIIAAAWIVAATLIDKYTPNSTVIDLYEYYGIDEGADKNTAFVYADGEKAPYEAYRYGDSWYFRKDAIDEYFNSRFYYDEKNDELIYTTPSKIMTIPFDSQNYYIGENAKKEAYIIAVKDGEDIYIAVDFIKDKADFVYEIKTAPYRMVISTVYGTQQYVKILENGTVRTDSNIKAAIISEGEGNFGWRADGEKDGWTKVVTADGIVGYIRSQEVGESYAVTVSNNYQPPIYTSVSKPYKINLVWHAVYNLIENEDIYPMLDRTEGVTTVSPTWYQITDSDGSMNSYAEQWYVDYIHENGMEIWPLISDFTSVDENGGWNEYELFADTVSRRKLITSIMNEINTYGFDGINIDFEKVNKETGIHFVQFLRELSIECRKAGVVLSIDDYIPMPHSKHYDRAEQGIVADYVIVMGYDEHYNGSEEAGSIASKAFVEKGITATLEEVPKEKLINALPFYTRIWEEYTDEEGKHVIYGKAYGMETARERAKELEIPMLWSDELGQFVGENDVENVHYSIWLEDEKSIEEKMKIIQNYDLAGVAAWSLGMEPEDVWNIINSYNHN